MGCACAKERDFEEVSTGKETLSRAQASFETSQGAAQTIRTLAAPLENTYRLGTTLKRSNAGELKRAEFLGTYQQCFMKIIKKATGRAKLQQRTRLNSEADRLTKLDHPFILKCYEAMQDDNNYYLATEAFTGGQLQDFLADPRFRNEGILARVMHQVFTTLSYCHQQGIIHGNVSPTSLVFPLMPEGNNTKVKLTGFGELDSIPSDFAVRESHFYAPERGTNNSEKSDIWSCGVLIYFLIAGQSPFGVPITQDVTPEALKAGVSFPSSVWNGKSREAMALLATMLDVNPQTRPTAAECRSHPWVTQNVKPLAVQAATVKRYLFSIKKIRRRTSLQNAALRFVLQRVTKDKDIESLLDPFFALDADSDGVLNREEVLQAFMRLLLEEDAIYATKRIFEITGQNGASVLTFSEFLICALGEKKLLTPENLRLAFSCIDRSGHGAVTVQDISSFYSIKDTTDLEQVAKLTDNTGASLVSFEGFSTSLCSVNL